MVDVFISYSRDDAEKVGVLARMIANEGYQVWWDADLPPHVSYGDVITAKISEAKAAVVVWSHTAAQSEWVRAEADVARNQKKLIQTALDDVMPPLPFNQIQCAAIGDWNGEEDHRGWNKVKESLVALCGPRAEPESGEVESSPEIPPEARPEPKTVAPQPTPPPPPAPPPNPAPEPSRAPSPQSETNETSGGTSTPVLLSIGCVGLVVLGILFIIFSAMTSEMEEYSATGSSDFSNLSSSETEPDGDYIPQLGEGTSFADLDAGMNRNTSDTATPLIATVQDPDGYSNVRATPSSSSDIVGVAIEGEQFLTFQQDTPWWIVTLEDGTMGYIYSDRILVIGTP